MLRPNSVLRPGGLQWPIVAVMVIVSALCVALFWREIAGARRQPTSEGQPLSAWLVDLNDLHANRAEAAATALRRIGTNAIPFLLDRLVATDLPREDLLERLCVFLHIKNRRGRAAQQHTEAVRAFRVLGTNADVALPELDRLLKGRLARADKDVAVAIAQAMGAVGAAAKPLLIAELENANPNVRLAALTALIIDLDAQAKDATPAVLARLGDTNAEIRSLALYFISRSCDDLDTKRNALLSSLHDPDAEVRRLASQELAKMDLPQSNNKESTERQ